MKLAARELSCPNTENGQVVLSANRPFESDSHLLPPRSEYEVITRWSNCERDFFELDQLDRNADAMQPSRPTLVVEGSAGHADNKAFLSAAVTLTLGILGS